MNKKRIIALTILVLGLAGAGITYYVKDPNKIFVEHKKNLEETKIVSDFKKNYELKQKEETKKIVQADSKRQSIEMFLLNPIKEYINSPNSTDEEKNKYNKWLVMGNDQKLLATGDTEKYLFCDFSEKFKEIETGFYHYEICVNKEEMFIKDFLIK